MEEAKTRPGAPGDRAQIAAEKLRALRQRANLALEEHRSRLSQIESELSQRVRQLAEEFEATSAGIEQQSTSGRDDEVAALRAQLEEGRAKHEKFVEQLAAARRQLDAIQNQPCPACQDAANQFADAQEEIRQLQARLASTERQREEDQARHQKFSEQVAVARQAIAELQAKSDDQVAELQANLDAALSDKAAAAEQVAALQRDAQQLNLQCESLQREVGRLEEQRIQCLEQQRGAADEELAAQRQRISTLSAELESQAAASKAWEDETIALRRQLDAAQVQADRAAADAARQNEQRQAEQAERDAELADLRQAHANALAEIQQHADRAAASERSRDDLAEQLAAIKAEQEIAAADLAEAVDQCRSLRAALAAADEQVALQAGLASELATLRQQLAESQSECQSAILARQQLETSLKAAESDLAQLRDASCPRQELQDCQQELDAAVAEALQLKEGSLRLQSELAARPLADEADLKELATVRKERDELRTRTEQLEAAAADCPREALDELQRKFDLALADAQRFKQENSRLHDELAARPQASEDDLNELVALRNERDDLQARVKDLENAAVAAATDECSLREVEDLQRRFQMAVDDVRQLKHENADLRERLDKAKPAPGALAAPGALDWAAQKARLLASLQEEDGHAASDARQKERANIETTIAATDKAIAEKDRTIAELRAAAGQAAAASVGLAERNDEVLNSDELIAQERKKLAAMQAELEGKLRSAELEFSVERAKLAREQAALKERLFELQKFEIPAAPTEDHAKPRRRWRSALGLGDEGDDSDKKPK